MKMQPALSVGIGMVVAGAVAWMLTAREDCEGSGTRDLCDIAAGQAQQLPAALVIVGIALCLGLLFARRDERN